MKGRTITVMGVGGAGMAICGQSALEGAKKIHVFARPTSRYWERAAAMAEKMSHMTECKMILHEMDDHAATERCYGREQPSDSTPLPLVWFQMSQEL